jgi:proton-translocating NADH-quinone oxidoreductase chain N
MNDLFNLTLDVLLVFTVTTPLVGSLASRIRKQNFIGIYALIGLAASGIALYKMYSDFSTNTTTPIATNIFSALLKTDMLSIFMTAIFIGVGLAAVVYSIKYMENDTGKPLYYTLLLAMISGMVGTVFSGDLFTLYVFWELMSISSYVLVAFRKETWEPVEAGFKYLIMSAAGSATVLFGMSFLYGMAGTLNFQGLATTLGTSSSVWLYVAFLFILVGFGVKTAIVPLHTWLPDAHSAAPTPISALLSGIVIETGLYALLRTSFSAFLSIQSQWFGIIAFLSILTMTTGNLMALLQKDVKRLLAYSSIGHMGYMLVGLALATQIGLTGTLLHIFNHALMKGAAFLCAGAIIFRLGTRNLDEMSGAGRKMPITTIFFAISLFALMGMPPLNGFISELTLITATMQSNVGWLGVAIILNSILSSAYYLRVLRTLIQPTLSDAAQKAKEAPVLMLIPIGVMTALIIFFGIYPEPVIKVAQQAATALLSAGVSR